MNQQEANPAPAAPAQANQNATDPSKREALAATEKPGLKNATLSQEDAIINADIDKETKEEMEKFDEEADVQANAEYGSDDDSYAMTEAELMLDADIENNGTCTINADEHSGKAINNSKAKVCTSEECLAKHNRDSSDEDCTCQPPTLFDSDRQKIMQIQAGKKAAAEAAKAKATELRKKAEEAIQAAHKARMDALQKASEASDKAQKLAVQATKAADKKVRTERALKLKVSLVESEKYDLNVKSLTHAWEESVVTKHEMWQTYKAIKKELAISNKNVSAIKKQLKEAEGKVLKLRKLAALNPKDIGAKEKIAEAQKLVDVIGKQLGDADEQKNKVDQEKTIVLAKAQTASINSAHAKAQAEHAFRKMVIQNNKVCNLCEQGKEKIRKRRAEIAGAIKEETRRKAERAAARRKESLAKTQNQKDVLDQRFLREKASLAQVTQAQKVETKPAASTPAPVQSLA